MFWNIRAARARFSQRESRTSELGPFTSDPRHSQERVLGQKLSMYGLGENFTPAERRVQKAKGTASTLQESLPSPAPALLPTANQTRLTHLTSCTGYTRLSRVFLVLEASP